MRFATYLKDRLVPLVVRALALAFCALAMRAYGVEPGVIGFVCVVLLVAEAAATALDYLHRAPFWRRLEETLDGLDSASLVTSLVERPEHPEGQVLYDVLDRESQDMRNRIADARRQQREYREYVETWVHEIKTPIAAARLIAKNNPSPVVDQIDDELDAIEGYVEQALYYSRGTSLERDFQIRPVRLDEVAREALRHKARTLIGAHVMPELGNLDFEVRADAKWLTFVIGQVLVNSAKYRQPGEGSAHVRISAKRQRTGLGAWQTVLFLSDDGVGIPASDVGRVFDKGFTGENGRRFARSTGMGLYLVKELCEKMGLTVALTSEENVGTTVSIAFPDSGLED